MSLVLDFKTKDNLLEVNMSAKLITFLLHIGWITCSKDVKLCWVLAKDFGLSPLILFGFLANRWLNKVYCDTLYGWVLFRFYGSTDSQLAQQIWFLCVN